MLTQASPPPPATWSISVVALTRGQLKSLRKKLQRYDSCCSYFKKRSFWKFSAIYLLFSVYLSPTLDNILIFLLQVHKKYSVISLIDLPFTPCRWERVPSNMPGCWTSWKLSVNVASPSIFLFGSSRPASTTSPSLMLQGTGTLSRTWSLGPHRYSSVDFLSACVKCHL